MRIKTTNLAIAVLLVGFIASANAFAQDTKKFRNYDSYEHYNRDGRDAHRAFRRLVPGYQARNPDNFRFGSDAWWKTMDAEGRGGHPRL